MRVHYTDNYLLNPQHVITVCLIGLGGTGSQMLGNLARLNTTLKALGHPGLHVYAYDGDTVSEANIGRQLFSPADIGANKAVVLVTRLDRFFGLDWEAIPEHYTGQRFCNIIITCVDTAAARIEVNEVLEKAPAKGEPTTRVLYWLDMGNLQKTGQVVLGTAPEVKVKQPKSNHKTRTVLPNVTKLFPSLKKIKEADQGPSCSLAEAISKQDLYINSTLAQFGANMLWKLFREGMIENHGCYVNLERLTVNPIKI